MLHKLDSFSSWNTQIEMSDKKKTFVNKMIILNYLQQNFSNDPQILTDIQESCGKARKIKNICKGKKFYNQRQYRFVIKENILFVEYKDKDYNKSVIFLPDYVCIKRDICVLVAKSWQNTLISFCSVSIWPKYLRKSLRVA